MKIKFKLILVFLIIVFCLVWIGYISVTRSREKLNASIGDGQTLIALGLLDKIDRDIYYRLEDAMQFSHRLLVQQAVLDSNLEFLSFKNISDYIGEKDREWIASAKEDVTSFMQGIIGNQLSDEIRKKIGFHEKLYGYRLYGEIFITNKFGVNIAQSGKTTDYYQADEKWWQVARDDGFYISDVEHDESSGVFSISFGMRIDDAEGNFIGVMKVVLNIEDVISIVKEGKRNAKFKSANFKLLDNAGRTIYDTEGNFKIFSDVTGEDFYRSAGSQSGYFVKLAESNDENELFAYARSDGYKSYRGLGWILFAECDAAELQRPTIELMKTLVLTSAVGIFLAALLGISVYRSIAKPLNHLVVFGRKISQGDLRAKADIKSKDEFGGLADVFNRMAGDLDISRSRLEDYSQALEKKVETRTEELELKNLELEKFNKLAVGRELKMIQLKKKIEELGTK